MSIRVLSAAIVCTTVLISSAAAIQPYGGGFNNWYPGYWYNVYGMEYIPYFSLHPPVYYSRPVPRTYGWSPFAYPPGTLTPEVEAPTVEPQVYRNPYVEEKPGASDDDLTQRQPLRVVNPYVVVDSNVQLSQSNGQRR
jgi:hypothetical protein